MKVRRFLGFVTLLTLVAALTGAEVAGAQSGGSTDYEYDDTPCPSPNVPGYPQLDLPPDFTCGTLTVPENRSKPDGRQIEVRYARAPAASGDSSRPPLLWLEGGPGGSAFTAAPSLVALGVNQDRDVIFVDQRGTYHSTLLNCPEISDFNREAVGLAPTRRAAKRRHVAATQACHDRWVADGADLAAFSTKENAADLADLREALGIEEWDVYGVSYGSDLAMQLVRDHPEGIRSLVLDSAVPPNLNLIPNFWPAAAEGFDAVFEACEQQPACNDAYPEFRQEFYDAVEKLDEEPLELTAPDSEGNPTKVVIDGYTLANTAVIMSFSVDHPNYSDLPGMINALVEGDGAPFAELIAGSLGPAGLSGSGDGLGLSVFCRESVAFTTPEKTLRAARRAAPEIPERVLRLPPQFPQPFEDCEAWDVPPAPRARAQARADVPVLVLSGSFDHVTPPSSARVAAKGFPNSNVVVIPGAGHVVVRFSDCAREVMANFLDSPDEYDMSCVDALGVPPFTVE
jgi:pimeloyl-ACP methyl ester carboxylesterase